MQQLPANSLQELEPSEELNGEDSQCSENDTKTIEDKQNVKIKFFMQYKLFDSALYLFFETALTVLYVVVIILLTSNDTSA